MSVRLALLLCWLAAGLVFRWGLGRGVPVWMRWKGIGTLTIFLGVMWLGRLWAEYRAVPVARQKVTMGDGLVTHVCGRETRWYVTRNLGEIESGSLLLKVQVYDKQGDSHWILVPRKEAYGEADRAADRVADREWFVEYCKYRGRALLVRRGQGGPRQRKRQGPMYFIQRILKAMCR